MLMNNILLNKTYVAAILFLVLQNCSICNALDCVLIGTTFDDSELSDMKEPRTTFQVVSISDGRDPRLLGSFTGLTGNYSLINSKADWLVITGQKFNTHNITAWHAVSISEQVIVQSGYCPNYFIAFKGFVSIGTNEKLALLKMRNVNMDLKEPRFIAVNKNGAAKQIANNQALRGFPGSGSILQNCLGGTPIFFQDYFQLNLPIDLLPPTGEPGIYHFPESVSMPPEFTEGKGGSIIQHDSGAFAITRPRNLERQLTVNSRIDYYIDNKWHSFSGKNILESFFLGDWLIIPEYRETKEPPTFKYERSGKYTLISVKSGEKRELQIEKTSSILMTDDNTAVIAERMDVHSSNGLRIMKYNIDTGESKEIYKPQTYWGTTYCLLCPKPVDKMFNNDAVNLTLDTGK